MSFIFFPLLSLSATIFSFFLLLFLLFWWMSVRVTASACCVQTPHWSMSASFTHTHTQIKCASVDRLGGGERLKDTDAGPPDAWTISRRRRSCDPSLSNASPRGLCWKGESFSLWCSPTLKQSWKWMCHLTCFDIRQAENWAWNHVTHQHHSSMF